MSTTIFPAVQPETEETASEGLSLCREVAWDYSAGIPLYSAGRPVVVTGAEAVKVWCWRALKTGRYRKRDIHTDDYGCELENLVGKPYTSQVKESEAIRYVREALAINPYVTGVAQVNVTFSDALLVIDCTVSTIYGEVTIHV